MSSEQNQAVAEALQRLEARLEEMNGKMDTLILARRKFMEWMANHSQQIDSLDSFREEVRATFEPLVGKLRNVDDIQRVLRHATSDLSRRMETLERDPKRKDPAKKAG